ncbi:multidrug MFS transporter [Loigolactobacillus backii]|uniref:sugar transferase n=1 Tax=Loigolactobacillus backii TaxID=375175 RepID=UPI000C1C8B7F|nr:sugar transferase [Loigolactobacillus backii]PIO82441.1 multidrug MFS transporter [Loigolactobacillus backii]
MKKADEKYTSSVSKNIEAMTTNNRKESQVYQFSKRGLDIILAGGGLVVGLPLILIISAFSKISDPKSPVFFSHVRQGKNQRGFNVYKFRTMICNAEQTLKQDEKLYAEFIRNGHKFPEGKDPRITRLGRFLRKTSLDELPQLFNVLKGDMSVVGPRPITSEELKHYGSKTALLLAVRPGLTGYWQVNGRSDVQYPERCELELFYVRHRSMPFDLKIIGQTALTVVTRKGAH